MSAKALSRPRAKPKGKASTRGRGKAPPPSPLAELVRRVSAWIFVAMLVALAVAALAVLRVPQMVGGSFGEAAGAAGFVVRGWEIRGTRHLDQRRINAVVDAVVKQNRAQPLVDIAEIRRQLLRFGWVADARVSRRLPDRLVVDIIERTPRAVWQNDGMLALIDGDGVALDYVKLDALPDLPLVIGPDANRHIAELDRLVTAAPRLKPVLSGASWVGGRRWDLRFHTGETLALPEGEGPSRKALAYFDAKDQAAQLLGHGFVRFDMRIPGKLIIRVSNEPGSSVPSIVPEVPPGEAAAPAPAAPAPAPVAPTPKRRAGSVPDATKTI
jgi:cell division protein FtsQ